MVVATLVLLLLTYNKCVIFGLALVNPAENGEEWQVEMSRTSVDEESPHKPELATDTLQENPDLLNQLHLALSSLSQNNRNSADPNAGDLASAISALTAGDLASAISALTAAIAASNARVDQQIMQIRQDHAAYIEGAAKAVQESFASLLSIATMAMENQAAVVNLQKSIADMQQIVDTQEHLTTEENEFSIIIEDPFAVITQSGTETDIVNGTEFILAMEQEDISVSDLVIPEQLTVGSTVLLECIWSGYPIYSLRWYKDDENIFTIIPEDDDKLTYNGVPGITVDVESSDIETLVLRDVSEATSGTYRCEVVGEGPHFQMKYVQRNMQIKDTPSPSTTSSMSTKAAGIPTLWCEEPGFILEDSCFKIVSTVRKSWPAARKYCQDQDADLAMPDNIRDFAKHLRERPNKEGKGRFWLRASYAERNKTSKEGGIKLPSSSSKGECLFIAPYAKFILKSRICKSGEAFICQTIKPEEITVATVRPDPVISSEHVGNISVSSESPDIDVASTEQSLAFTDAPYSDLTTNSTLQPITTDDVSLEPLLTTSNRDLKVSNIESDSSSILIFAECRPPYFQVGSECFMVHLKPHTRHEAESFCTAMDGRVLAQPNNIGLLRDYLYKLQDFKFQVDFWLGSWALIPSNMSIPGEDLLPENHNWCVVFTPRHCPYLAIDHCHTKKPVVCQVNIESNEFTTEIPIVGCPPASFQLGSQCFQYHIEDETWFTARANCQEQGGDLAQPHDLSILRRELIYQHADWDFWLGGSDLEVEGKWTWLSGTEITGPWRRRQPSGGKKENCLDFRKGAVPQINDYKCERKQKYICEFDPVIRKEDVSSSIPQCNSWCRPPYFMLGNECFALINHNRTWEEAEDYCLADGRGLVHPQHLDALSNYLTLNLAYGAIKDFGKYWLGGKERNDQDIDEQNNCLELDIYKEKSLSSNMCNSSQSFICQAVQELWQEVGSQELLVNDFNKATWSEASEHCQESGGRLATIFQHDDFVNFMHSQYRFKSLWVGASNRGKEGQWHWSSGTSLDPDFPWNITQPIADFGEECMQLSYYALDKMPIFESRDCEEKVYYVCDSNTPETNRDLSVDGNDNIEDEIVEDHHENDNLEDNSLTKDITNNESSNNDNTQGITAIVESTHESVQEMGNEVQDIYEVTTSIDYEFNGIHIEVLKENSEKEVFKEVTERNHLEVAQTPPNEKQVVGNEHNITKPIKGDVEVIETPLVVVQ